MARTNPNGRYFCTACKSYFKQSALRGSGFIELLLYVFVFIIGGVIYSIWRRSGACDVCPMCHSSAIIDSQAGTHVKCPDCRELIVADAKKCHYCGCALIPAE